MAGVSKMGCCTHKWAEGNTSLVNRRSAWFLVNMAKFIIASTILATASAFLGVAPSAPAPQLHAAGIEDYIGADIETAGLWDPLGLSKDTDRLYRWRCVEIKHGRVAMLATVGYLYNDLKLTLPGVLSPSEGIKFENVPTGLAATHGNPNSVPIAGWVQMIFFIGVMETTVFKQDPAKAPGDVGGVFFRRYSDPAEKADKLKSELKNGRLAMMGIMGMLVTDQLTGLGPVTQLMTTKVVPF